MGCFLACFGSSKQHKPPKQRNRVTSRDQEFGVQAFQIAVHSEEVKTEKPFRPVSIPREKSEEILSLNSKKKVTFNTKVTTYDSVPTHDDKTEEGVEKEKKKEDKNVKIEKSTSISEEGSITSSVISFPPNHRYQNCRMSDDEDEKLDYDKSELNHDYEESEGEEEEEEVEEEEEDYGDYDDGDREILSGSFSMESRNRRTFPNHVISEEVDSPLPKEKNFTTFQSMESLRDRGLYVNPVLNPVENLTQWKAVKARGKPTSMKQKENLELDEEPQISLTEASFKQSNFGVKSKSNSPIQDAAVDASLSNWLGSSKPLSETTSTKKKTLETFSSEKSMSYGSSNSYYSLEDRPILGALTFEEIKQFSASSLPRKSPSRSPDEMPILGTVGNYWSHNDQVSDSGSVSSYRGMPNTPSKYREDKRENWHGTPFETRLGRALEKGAAEAYQAKLKEALFSFPSLLAGQWKDSDEVRTKKKGKGLKKGPGCSWIDSLQGNVIVGITGECAIFKGWVTEFVSGIK
ncbi:hypothetical protein RJ641_030153, partial [Dillenia turbinata]